MKQEIERKFLVKDHSWRLSAGVGVKITQGYLSSGAESTVRVRVAGGRGFLTVKGRPAGIARTELEYEIPPADALYMIEHLCGGRVITKTRYTVKYAGAVWEIDEFSGAHTGLVLAEIELEAEDQPVGAPDWLGEEVSADRRYTNAALAETTTKKI
ncbi:MAG: CYTH domain-containing protein [Kiritimatiellales bacterium]